MRHGKSSNRAGTIGIADNQALEKPYQDRLRGHTFALGIPICTLATGTSRIIKIHVGEPDVASDPHALQCACAAGWGGARVA